MEVELREPRGGGSVTAACGGGELGHLGGCVSYFKGGKISLESSTCLRQL